MLTAELAAGGDDGLAGLAADHVGAEGGGAAGGGGFLGERGVHVGGVRRWQGGGGGGRGGGRGEAALSGDGFKCLKVLVNTKEESAKEAECKHA